ncbi:ribose-5-phosphate isomerase [Candidatus Cerribacteria bacterium 'Amazon FNV 2010 28 9']|uniref:Ribose-5-phosphate isomerase n=1 Tax=Candidatus Cerribacteria bacterium 'Amazon FNV 2010 28 9' TaxID=2081795 RepID=A0A317JPB6_9BACT|nr:MAG: ribose-5-phosphate isomerase [Candidatus Cerribacteria bacterium 'Amazon FNV 2010 28 9']
MVYLGSDHGGFELKQKAKEWIKELGFDVEDLGDNAPIDQTDDYPLFAQAVSKAVRQSPINRGILFCKSGGGMTIAANKENGIRAVNVIDEATARQAREHLDANIIAIGSRWVSEDNARKAIATFLTTMFSEEERHKRRIEEMKNEEK